MVLLRVWSFFRLTNLLADSPCFGTLPMLDVDACISISSKLWKLIDACTFLITFVGRCPFLVACPVSCGAC